MAKPKIKGVANPAAVRQYAKSSPEEFANVRLDRLDQAIAVMERAAVRYMDDPNSFNLGSWSNEKMLGADESCYSPHCGMSACFGGWLAISPEWRAAGGCAGHVPVFGLEIGPGAIAEFLGAARAIGYGLTMPDSPWYSGKGIEASPEDVLILLRTLRECVVELREEALPAPDLKGGMLTTKEKEPVALPPQGGVE